MTVRAVVVGVAMALMVVGCGSAASPSPAPSQVALPTVAPTPSVVASPSPIATPVTTPVATASASACSVEPQTGILPSDRWTGIEFLGLPGRDAVRFVFGKTSLEPVGRPTGGLETATPPFTEGASGLPIDLRGEHAVQVVFRGMSLQNDVGQPTYDGQREFTATDPTRSLRHAVLFDESEGQVGWYFGYDGPGCVTLTREGDTLVLVFESGPGN